MSQVDVKCCLLTHLFGQFLAKLWLFLISKMETVNYFGIIIKSSKTTHVEVFAVLCLVQNFIQIYYSVLKILTF